MSRLLALLCLAVPALVFAQNGEAEKKDDKWDVNAAHWDAKDVTFKVSEGTWMNLDVSPDGREIVFDLLGDLYLLPIDGGEAKPLLVENAWAMHPRFSPDGRHIAFASDRGAGDNLWIIARDGGEPEQVTKEDFRLLANPVWTPDGEYLIGRKHFTSTRSLGAGEMWIYHRSGGGGLQLTKRKNDQQDVNEPALSPDGRYLYFSEDMSGGSTFQYNKDPHGTIYVIRRLDRESGELSDLVRIQGGAVRPQPSPDGKHLAFVRRVRDKSVLHTFDLTTGAVRPVWNGLSHDQQEAWAIHGVYPNFQWTPDGKRIVIWAQGGLWSVDAASGAPTRIPFSVEVNKQLHDVVKSDFRIEEETFRPRLLRDVATSPDGRHLVFHAVGSLWKVRLPDGAPQRLTDRDEFEYEPSFSPDGRQIIYVTWSDAETSAIRRVPLSGGRVTKLSADQGFYGSPRYSPDGRRIVYQRGRPHGLIDYRFGLETGLYVMDADGANARRFSREGSQPQWHPDGERVFFMTGGGLDKTVKSSDLHGAEVREHFKLKYPTALSISPDGRFAAFVDHFNAYVAAIPPTGSAVEIGKDAKTVPLARVSADAGPYLHWSADGTRLHWMLGPRYYTRELAHSFKFLDGAPDELPKAEDTPFVEIDFSLPLDTPDTTIALTNARIVSMRGDEIIEAGTVLVEGPRIVAVGSDVEIPGNARVVDVEGKTIIPGIIDVHAHAAHFHSGISPQQNWAYYANLAYGVTTMHDPSVNTETAFSHSELVKAGRIVGPRSYSTGTILYGADGSFRAEVKTIDDARAHLRRLQAVGAFSVKSYNQPRRDQRQMVNLAARELGMNVVMEGGSTYFHNLTMVLDGSTGIEHNLPIAPLYDDVLTLWSHSGVANTPTLVVGYGGLTGEFYWYENDNVWEEERIQRFYPREAIDSRAIRRQKTPEWDYNHFRVARAKKALSDHGVRILVGGHGQMQGLAPHWEIWMLVQGGFSEHEALRAATLHGAEYIGFGEDLGSIEPGKLADLVVLEGDPLADIRASKDVHLVMANGRLFDGASMAERESGNRPAPTFYWQRHGAAAITGAGTFHGGPTGVCHCPASQRDLRAWR